MFSRLVGLRKGHRAVLRKRPVFIFAPSPGFAFGEGDTQPQNLVPSAPIRSAERTQPSTLLQAWHRRGPRLFQRTPIISTNSPVSPFYFFFPGQPSAPSSKVRFWYFSAPLFGLEVNTSAKVSCPRLRLCMQSVRQQNKLS